MDRREYKRQWTLKNKAKAAEYQRKYRRKNKDKVKKRNKAWREKHKDKRNAQARREYAKRKDHYSSKVREYGDRKFPARAIRRATRQYKNGDIDRDELLNRINEVLNGHDAKDE